MRRGRNAGVPDQIAEAVSFMCNAMFGIMCIDSVSAATPTITILLSSAGGVSWWASEIRLVFFLPATLQDLLGVLRHQRVGVPGHFRHPLRPHLLADVETVPLEAPQKHLRVARIQQPCHCFLAYLGGNFGAC